MGNFMSASPRVKRYSDVFVAATAPKKSKSASTGPSSTGPAVLAPWVQTTTEGDLSVNRKKRRGKASLTIDKTNSTNMGTGSSGLNI